MRGQTCERNDHADTILPPLSHADDATAVAIEQEAAPAQAQASSDNKPTPLKPTKLIAYRAQETLADLSGALRGWYEYYSGYDPLFTWWNAAPYKKTTRALDAL